MNKNPLLYCLLLLAASIYIGPIMAQNSEPDKTFKSYYDNGKLKEVTHQGLFSGCGVPVGTDSIFERSGKLAKTILYKHRLKNGNACHNIITSQTITTYYPNGRRKSAQHIQACYECTPVAVGKWEWYNSKGQLIRTEKK